MTRRIANFLGWLSLAIVAAVVLFGCRQPAEPRNLCDTATMVLVPTADSLRTSKLPTATIITCRQ